MQFSRSGLTAAAFLFSCVGALACCGCSDPPIKTYQTTGRVVYSDDQTPVPGGVIIVLESTTAPYNRSSANLEKDGTFTLSSRRKGDGAIEGKHRVRFTADPTPATPDPNAIVAGYMDARFTDFEKSGLIVEIKSEDENDLLIEVDKPEGGVKAAAPPES